MYILVDGIDGTGKTTLCDNLFGAFLDRETERNGWGKVDIESLPFPSEIPTGQDKYDPTSRALFHLSDFHHTLRKVHGTEHLIFDRSFVSTLAYQGFRDETCEVDPYLYESILLMGSQSFLRSLTHDLGNNPILFLHVTADVDVAVERIQGRDTDRVDVVESGDREWQREYLSTLQRRLRLIYADLERRMPSLTDRQVDFFEVDTTVAGEEDILDALVSYLKPTLWPDQLSLLTSG